MRRLCRCWDSFDFVQNHAANPHANCKTPGSRCAEACSSTTAAGFPDTPAKPVLPMIQQPLIDPVESLIARSQESFLRGEKNLKAGYMDKAKKDFDESLDVLFRSGVVISQEERLERHYEGLIDRIHNYELAALKEGDGFNEEKVEQAPLDEIATGEVPLTFDPKSKQMAEQTVQETPTIFLCRSMIWCCAIWIISRGVAGKVLRSACSAPAVSSHDFQDPRGGGLAARSDLPLPG